MKESQEIKEVINTFYEILSGKKNEQRDWERFRYLFFKGACLTKNSLTYSGGYSAQSYDVESYIVMLSQFLKKKDFFEEGYDYRILIFGNIAQVSGTYEARESLAQIKPVKSGVNLVQLIRDGKNWKIMNMLWEDSSGRSLTI